MSKVITIDLPILSTLLVDDTSYNIGVNHEKGIICFYTKGKKDNIKYLMSIVDFVYFRKIWKDLEKDIEDITFDMDILERDIRKIEVNTDKIEDNSMNTDELLKEIEHELTCLDGLYVSDNEEFEGAWRLDYTELLQKLENRNKIKEMGNNLNKKRYGRSKQI